MSLIENNGDSCRRSRGYHPDVTAPRARIELTDWRVRTATAFAEARQLAERDPAAAHAEWTSARDRLFRDHPQSPLPPDDPLRETGLPYFDYDPAYRFCLAVLPPGGDEDAERTVDAGPDGTLAMRRVGRVELPAPVGGSLDVWWLAQYAGGLFVPLRDATAGDETYGGGRYLLDTAKGAWHGGSLDALVLDLNFAYHPSCRYDPAWQCPLAPPGNTITTRVESGERLPERP